MHQILFYVSGVMYLDENDVAVSTLGKLKNIPNHGGNPPYDIWLAFQMSLVFVATSL